jgi:small subunit ribosomal protein S17e
MPVDPEDVTSIGDSLLERYPDAFSDDFEENKRTVERLTELRSHHVRNRVAGYVTRATTSETTA